MSTAQKIHLDLISFIGNNVVNVSGNDLARIYDVILTNEEFGIKVKSVWEKAGANVTISETGPNVLARIIF